jgi:hypothetical protein
MTEKDINLKSAEEGLTLENIKVDLGYDFLLLEDNIAYSCQKLIERFATKYFKQLPCRRFWWCFISPKFFA